MRELLNSRVQVEDMELTPLGMACVKGSSSCVPLLLDKGADYNLSCTGSEVDDEEKVSWERKPLHLAIQSGKRECVEMLLEHGADVNQKSVERGEENEFVQTALDMALQKRRIDMVDLICKYNVSTTEDIGEERKVEKREKVGKDERRWMERHKWEIIVGVAITLSIFLLVRRKKN